MNFRIGSLFLLAASAMLAGCAGKPFIADPLSADEVGGRRIAMLPPNYIEKPSVEITSNIVGFAGTAGKIAVIKGRDTKRRKLHEALTALGYDYREETTKALLEGLAVRGYDVELVPFRRTIDNILEAVPPGRFEKRPPRLAPEYDLVLDMYVSYIGFSAPTLGDPYVPTYHVGARVLDADTLEVLYQGEIHYHSSEPEGHEVQLEVVQDTSFENFDAVIADIEVARDRLSQAVGFVIDALIDELDPNS